MSSFLLSKRGSSKSGSSDKECKTKMDADLGKPTGEAEDEKETDISETPLGTSKSEDSKLRNHQTYGTNILTTVD